MDEIQADLLKWTQGDRRAGIRVVRALTGEWKGRIRTLLRAEEDRVEEVLQEMFVQLLVPRDGKPPKALAPAHATSAKAWRRTVLKNAVVSWLRHEGVHERTEQAWRHDLGKDAARDLAKQRREGPVSLAVVPNASDGGFEALEGAEEMAARRQAVLRHLPKLAVRRRVDVALALGIDPVAWVLPLAAELEEEPGVVAERMAQALAGGPPHLVAHPEGGGEEAFRKAVERGAQDLRRLLAEEGP